MRCAGWCGDGDLRVASTLAIRAALKVDPAAAIGG
jgi:hypothetical protein